MKLVSFEVQTCSGHLERIGALSSTIVGKLKT
jgi:hypothetical protein